MWCWVLSDLSPGSAITRSTKSLNAPSGAGCFLTSTGLCSLRTGTWSLNAPCGAGCFLARPPPRQVRGMQNVLMHLLVLGAFWPTRSGARFRSTGVLMHLLVLGAFWPPASGNGVVAPLPGAEAPPAPQAPREAGRHRPYLTTFRRPDAKRHRRTLGHLRPPASNDVKPKGRRSGLWLWTQPTAVEMEPGSGLDVRSVSHAEPPGRPLCQRAARSHRR